MTIKGGALASAIMNNFGILVSIGQKTLTVEDFILDVYCPVRIVAGALRPCLFGLGP